MNSYLPRVLLCCLFLFASPSKIMDCQTFNCIIFKVFYKSTGKKQLNDGKTVNNISHDCIL